MTEKFTQKGLSNEDKKEYRLNKINDLLTSINKINFIKDWLGSENQRPLTTSEIQSKYNIPDSRYLHVILKEFNLERRSTGESNKILGRNTI